MPLNRAAQTLTTLPAGTRVVVRYRIPGGLTDALGYLRDVDTGDGVEGEPDAVGPDPAADSPAGQPGMASPAGQCIVETRTGDVVIALGDVQAAKEVPPPPPRRR